MAAIVLVGWKLDGTDSSSSLREGEGKPTKFHRIDFLGSASLALTISAFILAIEMGGQQLPWSHPYLWILFGASAFFGLLFLLVEAFVAHEPILPLRLLFQRDMVTTNTLAALQSAAQFAVWFPLDDIARFE